MNARITQIFSIAVLIIIASLAQQVRAQQIKYARASIRGLSSFDQAIRTAIDADGSVYTLGIFFGDLNISSDINNPVILNSGGNNALFLHKHDRFGNLIWGFTIGCRPLANGGDLELDDSGYLYVTSVAELSSSQTFDADPSANTATLSGATASNTEDIFVGKYDGRLLPANTSFYKWGYVIGGLGDDVPHSLAFKENDIFLSGQSGGLMDVDPSSNTNNVGAGILAIKYDGSVNPSSTSFYNWSFAVGGGSPFSGAAVGIDVDSSGNVYLGGFAAGAASFDADPSSNTNSVSIAGVSDIFLGKYNGNLNPSSTSFYQWAFTMGGGAEDALTGMDVTRAGMIYIAGYFISFPSFDADPSGGTTTINNSNSAGSPSPTSDMFIAKYDGTLIPSSTSFIKWAAPIGDSVSEDRANGIETDAKELVYLGATIGGISSTTVDLNPGPPSADKPTTSTFTSPAVAKFDGIHTPIGTGFFLAFVIPQTTGSGFSADIATNALGDFALVGVFQGANVDFAPDSTTFLLESASNGNQQSSFVARYEGGMIWTGDSSTAWEDPFNWDGVLVPDSTNDVYIPDTGVTNQPTVSNSTFINALHISSGNTLTINPTVILEVEHALENDATVTGAGRIMLGGKIEQLIYGTGAISNLELQNISGAAIVTLDTQNITGTYFPTNGVLTTNNGLALKSSGSGTAQVANGSNAGGYISGNVIVERFVPGGRRAFRFFGHPFNTSIALSQLVSDDLDITGSGGATNGFTASGTNNPSAFYYDHFLGDTTTVGNNPGWQAYTSANTAQWQQYQAARILMRGSKGQGLNGQPYTPSAVTLDMTGALNQGTQIVNFTKGDSTDFVLVGNPFPSQIDLNLTTRSNIGSAFIVWDANQGVKGGYTSSPFSNSYIFPSCGSFVTTLTASSGSITFEEGDKSTGVPTNPFKTTAATNTVQLRIVDDTLFWDRILLRFDPATTSAKDNEDAIKLNNPDLDFSTIAADGRLLSIDSRPYLNGEVIQLSLRAFALKTYKIVVPDFDIPAGTKIYLYDKYLNKTEELYPGYEYSFTVSSDTLSQGKRFALNLAGDPNNIGQEVFMPDKLQISVHPNPVTDKLRLSYSSPVKEKMSIRITNITGNAVFSSFTEEQYSGSVTISLLSLPTGIYIMQVTGTAGTFTQKLLKQ